MPQSDPTQSIKQAIAGKATSHPLAPPTRPRRSIARRMLRWMFVVAMLPALVCMVLFNLTVQQYLHDKQEQDSQTLGEVVAASLAGRVDHFARHPGELLDGLGRDPRVAFVCVTDPKGKLLHAGVFDDTAWDSYKGIDPTAAGVHHVAMQDKWTAGLYGKVVARSLPITDASGGRASPDRAAAGITSPVQGYVVLGIRDTGLRNAVMSFQTAQVLTVVAVCVIVMPLVAWVLGRWVRPWRELVTAIRRLAEGNHIEPVTVRGEDEVGYLCAAFNHMAGTLIERRRQLEDANSDLEGKVRQRTLELQIEKEKLETAAYTDQLTGLANRRAFSDALKKRFAEASLNGEDLCVMVIDLDGFKGVNDTFGHDKGDEILKCAATAMKKHARPDHVPARMGGDEFLLLMPRTPLAEAVKVCDRIRDEFASKAMALLPDTAGLTVSMSQGLASIKQAQPEDEVRFITVADKALYAAKSAGKSCLVVFDPQVHAVAEVA